MFQFRVLKKSLQFGFFFLRMASFGESKALSTSTTTVQHLGEVRSAAPKPSSESNEVIMRWKDYRLIGEMAQNDWVQHLDLAGAQNFINFGQNKHPPKILLLYGSLRPVSYSKKLCYEFARVLEYLGAECRVFDPRELPMHDVATYESHPKVKELRELSEWSEGQVWVSPEQHGAITGVMKTQIDWIPLSIGSVRPTQGRTLALAQVSGGSQSFNVVNTLRLLGRWMRMITIPNQSSVPKAWTEFEVTHVMSCQSTSCHFQVIYSPSPHISSHTIIM